MWQRRHDGWTLWSWDYYGHQWLATFYPDANLMPPAPRQYPPRSRTPPGRDHQAPVTPPKASAAPRTPPKASPPRYDPKYRPKGKAKGKPKAQKQRRSEGYEWDYLQGTTQQRPSTAEIKSVAPDSEKVYARVPFNAVDIGFDNLRKLMDYSHDLCTKLKFRDGNRRVGRQGDPNKIIYDGRVTIFGPEARHIWTEFLKLARLKLSEEALGRFDQIKADLRHGFAEGDMEEEGQATPGRATPRDEAPHDETPRGGGETSQQATASTGAASSAYNDMEVDYDPDDASDTDLPAGTKLNTEDTGLNLYELHVEPAIADDTPRAEAAPMVEDGETSQQAPAEEGEASLPPAAVEGEASQQAAAETQQEAKVAAQDLSGPPPPPPQAAQVSAIPPPPPVPASSGSPTPPPPLPEQQRPHFDWYSDILEAKGLTTSSTASGFRSKSNKAPQITAAKPLKIQAKDERPPLQRRRVPGVTLTSTQGGFLKCLCLFYFLFSDVYLV